MKFFIFPFAIYNVKSLENITYEPDEGMMHFVFKSSKCYVRTTHGNDFLKKIEWFLRNSDSFLDVYQIRKTIEEKEEHIKPKENKFKLLRKNYDN